MKLVVGLGNPEPRYDLTRHNVGFWVLDQLALVAGLTFTTKPKHKAEIAEMTIGDEKILLVKPSTYYNLAGESIRSIVDFYKINPKDILVIHDELMLSFNTVRMRRGGSSAGNNGLKSLESHIGADTARIRIGIANDMREKMDDADFVLGKFSTDEIIQLSKLLPKITDCIDDFIAERFMPTTHK